MVEVLLAVVAVDMMQLVYKNDYTVGPTAYTSYTFYYTGSPQSFTVNTAAGGEVSTTVEILLVGGGGGGGADIGGGGGGGGFREISIPSLSAGSYTVVVGGGGATTTLGSVASRGGNSSIAVPAGTYVAARWRRNKIST